MPDLDDDNDPFAVSLCDVCRQLACACAPTVAEIDAWADTYLGSEQCAQDYVQARTTAQKFLANLHPGSMERPRVPVYLEDMEPPLHGDDVC